MTRSEPDTFSGSGNPSDGNTQLVYETGLDPVPAPPAVVLFAVGLVGLALVLLGISGAAQGAAGDPFVKSCVSQIGGSPCASLAPAFKATDVEPSPDARASSTAVPSKSRSAMGR